MDFAITIQFNLKRAITEEGYTSRALDFVMQAGMFKVEKAYVDEAPGDEGKFKQGIEVHKNKPLDYVVRSTAKNEGKNYPLILFHGTGKMKGKPDFGFTTGHVRAGTVAYGIGGIRPNKAATRAKKKVEKDYMNFVISKYKQQLNK
jgi:hypothetical protein